MGGNRRRRVERSSSSIDRRYKKPRNSSERHRRNESRNRRARRRSWNKKNSDHFVTRNVCISRLLAKASSQESFAIQAEKRPASLDRTTQTTALIEKAQTQQTPQASFITKPQA
ncbi:unnamed protein product [Gongylonema pulchrum]|uniref:Female-specific transformer n=1 Tax=Gongylonema pulchrum TaxID=637853 RepID=A0A183DRQ2_9BILA|nr:unnamed protein product [Gongylonema pulchrum]